MTGSAPAPPKIPAFSPSVGTQLPPFQAVDLHKEGAIATSADENVAQNSRQFWAGQNPGVNQQQNALVKQGNADWSGSDQLTPQLQNEAMTSGLEGSLGSFGQPTGVSGTAGGAAGNTASNANVARNLGTSILGYQSYLRGNQMNDLNAEESIFPKTQVGLSGADMANLSIGNVQGQNNYNQANYANELGIDQTNAGITAQNVANQVAQGNANTQAGASGTSAITGIASSALMALAAY